MEELEVADDEAPEPAPRSRRRGHRTDPVRSIVPLCEGMATAPVSESAWLTSVILLQRRKGSLRGVPQ